MSVRVADRKISSMEYIHNAQKIVYIVDERINKYIDKIANEKRYKHFTKSTLYSIWNAPTYHARMIYQYCLLANKERDSIKRLNYLNNASDNLELLKASVQTLYEKFRRVIKDKFIFLLDDLLEYQKKLLNGCKNYSKNVSCKPLLARL